MTFEYCLKTDGELEIGTWSNEMAENMREAFDSDDDDAFGPLPSNINLLNKCKLFGFIFLSISIK